MSIAKETSEEQSGIDDDLHPFGGFVSTSPLSTKICDPLLILTSNIIRDNYGVCVQAVADFMLTRIHSKLSFDEIVSNMKKICKREFHNDRQKLVSKVKFLNRDSSTVNSAYRYQLNHTLGPPSEGYVAEPDLIRAALLVLIQQNIVAVHSTLEKSDSRSFKHKYSIDCHRVCNFIRYPRFVEHSKGLYGSKAAFIVEEILLNGRLRTNDVVLLATKAAVLATVNPDEVNEEKSEETDDPFLKVELFGIFRRMVEGGHIEMVRPIDYIDEKEEEEEKEHEIKINENGDLIDQSTVSNVPKKRKLSETKVLDSDLDSSLSHLMKNDVSAQKLFPVGAVWRINTRMFQKTIRALILGRLVAERYGKKVQNAGSLITAALKFLAHKEHSTSASKDVDWDDKNTFQPIEISQYLPPSVRETYTNKQGGLKLNLTRAFVSLSSFDYPACVVEIEDHKSGNGGKFEISINSLLTYLRSRLTYQAIKDHLGELSARIFSVLQSRAHLESEKVADFAMLPAKEAREVSSSWGRYVSHINDKPCLFLLVLVTASSS